jgi:hypothetical protein
MVTIPYTVTLDVIIWILHNIFFTLFRAEIQSLELLVCKMTISKSLKLNMPIFT